jgi:Flp pilus assembly protein TadB
VVTRGQARLRAITTADESVGPRIGRRWALAVATAFAGWLGIGGAVGLVVGLGTAAGIVLTARLAVAPEVAAADVVPVVVELLAGCLDAGLTMPDSLDAASVAGDSVISHACLATAAALRRGAPADEAWQLWTSDPWLEPVARATRRTTQTGASVTDELRRVAARLRSRRQVRLQQRVQQASVWVVMPLGLFFLPAFVLIAVVPIVIGLLSGLR